MDVAIFWDFENVRVPQDQSSSQAALAIQKAVLALPDVRRILHRRLYYDAHKTAERRTDRVGLSELGFTLVDCPARGSGQKETIDKKLIVDAMHHGLTESERGGKVCIVLITSDGDFAYLLSRLRDARVYTVVIHGDETTTARLLLDACDVALNWRHDVLAPVTHDDEEPSAVAVALMPSPEPLAAPPSAEPPPAEVDVKPAASTEEQKKAGRERPMAMGADDDEDDEDDNDEDDNDEDDEDEDEEEEEEGPPRGSSQSQNQGVPSAHVNAAPARPVGPAVGPSSETASLTLDATPNRSPHIESIDPATSPQVASGDLLAPLMPSLELGINGWNEETASVSDVTEGRHVVFLHCLYRLQQGKPSLTSDDGRRLVSDTNVANLFGQKNGVIDKEKYQSVRIGAEDGGLIRVWRKDLTKSTPGEFCYAVSTSIWQAMMADRLAPNFYLELTPEGLAQLESE